MDTNIATVEAGGEQLALAYVDSGSGDPPLVFIHGWTCDGSVFRFQRRHFAARHRVLAIDLRGHGRSSRPASGYTPPVMAGDLAALLPALGVSRAVVAGHSLGGLVALELAASEPELVAAVVMIDPAPIRPGEPVRQAVEHVIDGLERGDDAARRAFVESMFSARLDPELRAELIGAMLSSPAEIAAEVLRGTLAYDALPAAASVRVPVLHLPGTPPRNQPHLLAEWLPGVVTGWPVARGHFTMLEAPDQVNLMIEAFLAQHVG